MNKKLIKKWIILVNLSLIALALPLSLVSGWLSTNLLATPEFEPVRQLQSDHQLDLSIYDNFSPESDPKAFQNLIIERIDQAQEEIIIAMYSFDIEEIKQALLRARQRGIKISLLYSLANQPDFQIFWGDAFEQIPPIYIGGNIGSSNYSMHHKFMLIDPESSSKRLLTGSWNWSYLQEDLDPNILLETTTPEIVASYYEEAKRLLNGYNGFNKFKLSDYRPWTDQISFQDGSRAEIWFSPGRERYSIQNRIVDLISSAQKSIDIANTVIDSTEIAYHLIDKAKDGIPVRIIFDHLNLGPEKSIYNYMQKRKEQFKLDNLELIIGGKAQANQEGLYSIFHHHNLIIDHKIVLTGTANWTFGGFFLNDENFLILHNRAIAEKFTDNFNNYLKTLTSENLPN